jgi:hypothetical protein
MTWPWVSRKKLDEMTRRLAQSDNMRVEDRLVAETRYEALKELLLMARADAESGKQERKLLMDRIVQMTGQPALYAQPQAITPAPELKANYPAAESRASFDDVHKALRQAMKDGTYAMKGRGN